MALCFFVSDLHGKIDRYQKLINIIYEEKPDAVFLGGDLLPSGLDKKFHGHKINNFIIDFLEPEFRQLRLKLEGAYPQVFLILGNDDGKECEKDIIQGMKSGLWEYSHNRKLPFGGYNVFGYSFIPPSPFMLKDWERYDVSRYVDPGCISPEDGWYSIAPTESEIAHETILNDIFQLAGDEDLSKALILFHAPPYNTFLDRAALDGKLIDHVPLDPHVGSIAIRRFIQKKQPLVTLHGHIHESARITGSWRDRIGETVCFSAAHDGPELALIRFDPAKPGCARRELV